MRNIDEDNCGMTCGLLFYQRLHPLLLLCVLIGFACKNLCGLVSLWLKKAQSLPGTLMGAFLRVEAAGMATTVDEKSGGRWRPKKKHLQ